MFAPFVARPGSHRPRHGIRPVSRPAVPAAASRLPDTKPESRADFGSVGLFAPHSPVQARLEVGAPDDPLEQEAERIADALTLAPSTSTDSARARPGPGRGVFRAGAEPMPATREGIGPSPESFRGKGEPIPAPVRDDFERRLDCDFGAVRLHRGSEAAASAGALGARAYTFGRDIVFGAGQYAPDSRSGLRLLAHELVHVVQQGGGNALVQRSPLSDSVKAAWTADPKIDSLLARLSQPDVQGAQADADVDAELARLLAARPDDLWVAQKIRAGELGKTTGALGPQIGGKPVARPIKAFFFQGATDRRALVIAGVHGTERQGIEVAERLVKDLQSQTQAPGFTTIIVPSMFPDNAASGKLGERESGPTPTNRNFPLATEDLAAAKKAGGVKAVDASKQGGKRTRAILPENLLLLELIERFRPERIISIHGTWRAGAAGVFYDRRSLTDAEVKAARAWAQGMAYMQIPPEQQEAPGGQERLRALEQQLFRDRLAQLSGQTEQTDRDLSLNTAKQIDAATKAIPDRDKRAMIREKEPTPPTAVEKAARKAHPSIAGNVGPTGAIDHATWTGAGTGGVSLGEYAAPRGLSVFTVEPPVNRNSADYPTKVDEITQAERRIELQAYADAVRTILLGKP